MVLSHLARSATGRVAAVGILFGLIIVWVTPWARAGALLVLGAGLLGAYAGWMKEAYVWLKASARTWHRAARLWHLAAPARPWLKAAPPPVELGWSIAIASMLLTLAWMAALQDALAWGMFTAVVTFALGVATVDFACLAWRVSRWLWSRATGKFFIGVLSGLVAPASLSWARAIVLAVSHEDPSKAPASVLFFTGVCALLAWINAVACISAVASLPVMVKTLVDGTRNEGSRERPRSIVWKLRRGIRPLFLCLAPFWVVTVLTTDDLTSNRWLRAAATITIVRLDYLEDHACGKTGLRANRIDDQRVSVIRKGDQLPAVETVRCERSQPKESLQ